MLYTEQDSIITNIVTLRLSEQDGNHQKQNFFSELQGRSAKLTKLSAEFKRKKPKTFPLILLAAFLQSKNLKEYKSHW